MTTSPRDTLQSRQQADTPDTPDTPDTTDTPDTESSPLPLPKTRRVPAKSPLSSLTLPYRRSNASLSNLFASTSSLPSPSPTASGTVTPPVGRVDGSVFSPGALDNRLSIPSPAPSLPPPGETDEARLLVLRAFAPHVSLLASPDCEELMRHKGINGGLLELLRPFGERVSGRVVVRDSTGASKPWDDYGIRFTGVKDGMEDPRLSAPRNSAEGRDSLPEYRPARLRTGGDVAQIDELVDRHLAYAEEQATTTDYLNHKDQNQPSAASGLSPFYALYLRRLLSGLPLTPHETFSHPVALVIAISSRNPSPIEELRNLYTSSNAGEFRLPPWVNNDYLRYYVLIHDEDYDDIKKSTALFEQMKRHFGLHCHLLRLRSNQCLPSDDDSMRLPTCAWMSAGEELAEIHNRETMEDDEDPTPYIFESDASAIKAFVREMVTQSIIPGMERLSATWNDQVASRRRGLSGRFMSLSKRFSSFGVARSATSPAGGAPGSNYDAFKGVYRPDTPEAVMRKLADYAFMLRDFKLAQSTYEMLCTDYKNDKAWKYYAGANEMAAITALLGASSVSAKVRVETIDQQLEAAYYSYTTRCASPYNAFRALAIGAELLRLRTGSALDDAARWAGRIIEDGLVGQTGHVLIMERIAAFYSSRQGVGGLTAGTRLRKAAFWNVLAVEAWLRIEKPKQADKRLTIAMNLYKDQLHGADVLAFGHMSGLVETLRKTIRNSRPEAQRTTEPEDLLSAPIETLQPVHQQQQTSPRMHRKSLSMAGPPASLDPLGVAPLSPTSATGERRDPKDEGFE